MNGGKATAAGPHPVQGQVVYLQLPAADIASSADFYEAVFGWSVDRDGGRFEAPGIIGEWTMDRPSAGGSGPVVWILADQLGPVFQRIEANGGRVTGRPEPDGGERYLVECDDPAGNRIGVAVAIRRRTESQTLIAVHDVEASSRWYQHVLGLRSSHGGPTYSGSSSSGSALVLQLHAFESDHHHVTIGDPGYEVGNGVVLWFGETADFDGTIIRAAALGATVVQPPFRNPSEGEGNGPGHPGNLAQGPGRVHDRRRQPRRRGLRIVPCGLVALRSCSSVTGFGQTFRSPGKWSPLTRPRAAHHSLLPCHLGVPEGGVTVVHSACTPWAMPGLSQQSATPRLAHWVRNTSSRDVKLQFRTPMGPICSGSHWCSHLWVT